MRQTGQLINAQNYTDYTVYVTTGVAATLLETSIQSVNRAFDNRRLAGFVLPTEGGFRRILLDDVMEQLRLSNRTSRLNLLKQSDLIPVLPPPQNVVILSTGEVASTLGLSQQSIIRLCDTKSIPTCNRPAVSKHHFRYINIHDLKAWADKVGIILDLPELPPRASSRKLVSPLNDQSTFTSGEVAQIFGVSPRTIAKSIDEGQLEGWKIPGSKDRRVGRKNLFRYARGTNVAMVDTGIQVTQVCVLVKPGGECFAEPLCTAISQNTGVTSRVISVSSEFDIGIAVAQQELLGGVNITLNFSMSQVKSLEKVFANPQLQNRIGRYGVIGIADRKIISTPESEQQNLGAPDSSEMLSAMTDRIIFEIELGRFRPKNSSQLHLSPLS